VVAETRAVQRRPGGRSARVVAAVHDAVNQLMANADAAQITVSEIAERAGVNPTSIYRRWGTLESLILDVEATRLAISAPMPNTGTLRGDLLTYATQAATDIARPGGLAFLQAVLRARDSSVAQPTAPLRNRAAQIQAMLDRAGDRGERALRYIDVLDCILAPIYLRTLFGIGPDAADLATFVERALTQRT
jgi:AcrR family transcriptional regulator